MIRFKAQINVGFPKSLIPFWNRLFYASVFFKKWILPKDLVGVRPARMMNHELSADSLQKSICQPILHINVNPLLRLIQFVTSSFSSQVRHTTYQESVYISPLYHYQINFKITIWTNYPWACFTQSTRGNGPTAMFLHWLLGQFKNWIQMFIASPDC
jgi:hypothetical protein